MTSAVNLCTVISLKLEGVAINNCWSQVGCVARTLLDLTIWHILISQDIKVLPLPSLEKILLSFGPFSWDYMRNAFLEIKKMLF